MKTINEILKTIVIGASLGVFGMTGNASAQDKFHKIHDFNGDGKVTMQEYVDRKIKEKKSSEYETVELFRSERPDAVKKYEDAFKTFDWNNDGYLGDYETEKHDELKKECKIPLPYSKNSACGISLEEHIDDEIIERFYPSTNDDWKELKIIMFRRYYKDIVDKYEEIIKGFDLDNNEYLAEQEIGEYNKLKKGCKILLPSSEKINFFNPEIKNSACGISIEEYVDRMIIREPQKSSLTWKEKVSIDAAQYRIFEDKLKAMAVSLRLKNSDSVKKYKNEFKRIDSDSNGYLTYQEKLEDSRRYLEKRKINLEIKRK